MSFTLYFAHRKVGRGNPVLRHSVLHFALRVEWWKRRNENINLNKYFIPSTEDRTHNQSRLQSLERERGRSKSNIMLYYQDI